MGLPGGWAPATDFLESFDVGAAQPAPAAARTARGGGKVLGLFGERGLGRTRQSSGDR